MPDNEVEPPVTAPAPEPQIPSLERVQKSADEKDVHTR